jgi:hypothetical protein
MTAEGFHLELDFSFRRPTKDQLQTPRSAAPKNAA